MNRIMATIAAALLMLSASALAAGTEHALGEHPAVIVKRMYDKQGYDYASKFYPHPARFYLYSEAPKETTDQATSAAVRLPGAQMPESTSASRATQVTAKKP